MCRRLRLVLNGLAFAKPSHLHTTGAGVLCIRAPRSSPTAPENFRGTLPLNMMLDPDSLGTQNAILVLLVKLQLRSEKIWQNSEEAQLRKNPVQNRRVDFPLPEIIT